MINLESVLEVADVRAKTLLAPTSCNVASCKCHVCTRLRCVAESIVSHVNHELANIQQQLTLLTDMVAGDQR
jgi:hypothetical protein